MHPFQSDASKIGRLRLDLHVSKFVFTSDRMYTGVRNLSGKTDPVSLVKAKLTYTD